MQGMPICFVQEIAISETVCAIFVEQKPIDPAVYGGRFETRVDAIASSISDLYEENKHRGQVGHTITLD